MNLSDIFCQTNAVSQLQRAFDCSKVPHAMLFAGSDGVGKFTTAKCFSKLLLCQNPQNGKSCDCCRNCKHIEADSHPDFHHIYKELLAFTKNPANRNKTPLDLPIDVIREFVIDKAYIKPVESAIKIFVIDEAQRLNNASQNALLKILEEPPVGTYFILLCTKLDSLLQTTKSRCQIIRFGSIDEEQIIFSLKNQGITSEQAKFLARFCSGSLGQAEQTAKLEPFVFEIKKQIITQFNSLKLSKTIDFAQQLTDFSKKLAESWQKLLPKTSSSDISRRAKKLILQIFISALADAMKNNLNNHHCTNFDQQPEITKLSEQFGIQGCAEMLEKCCQTDRFIDASVNEKLIFEHLLINLIN